VSASSRASSAVDRPAVDLRGVLRAAAWLVVGAAVVRLIDGFLGSVPAAAPVLGALAVDLIASRAGVRWSEHDPPPWSRDLRRGAAVGGTAALAVLLVGATLGWAKVGLGTPNVTLAFGLVRVFGEGTRDAMLLVGLPVTLGLRAGIPKPFVIAFAALATAAPLALAANADLAAVASAAAVAALCARLVIASRGVASAGAALVAWLLVLGPLSRGGMVDVAWLAGDPGPPPHAEGFIAWIGVGVVLAAAAFAVPRFQPPSEVTSAARDATPVPKKKPKNKAPETPPAATSDETSETSETPRASSPSDAPPPVDR
jgi:hypothetical protein